MTPRDASLLEVFRAIRFAETSQLGALLIPDPFPTAQKLRLRLGRLEEQGYVARLGRRLAPRREEEHALVGEGRPRGRPEHVWALADHGARFLGLPGDWNRNNGRLRPSSFQHPLMVTKVYVTLGVAVRRGLVDVERWIGESQWKTSVRVDGANLPVVPDATCLVGDRRTDREAPFFLEVDNGTAPRTRRTFTQSSFRKKCVAYWHYWREEMRPHGDPLIVLTVAKTAARAEALRETAKNTDPQGRGLNLFWFTTEDQWTSIEPERFLYEPIWTTAAGERRALFMVA